MSKIILNNLGSDLSNETTTVGLINTNNDTLETAVENTLSRDGTSPNSMEANLDMGSHRILNLPSAVSDLEPLRLTDLDLFKNGSITFNNLPTGGTTGQLLKKNSNTNYDFSWGTAPSTVITNTSTGTGAVSRTLQSKLQETVSVRDFGAAGDSVTDDYLAIQACIDYLVSTGNGGVVFFPTGVYVTKTQLVIDTSNVSITLKGTTMQSSVIQADSSLNTRMIYMNGGRHAIEHLTIFGPGVNGALAGGTGINPGSVSSTANAIEFGTTAVDCRVSHCYIAGGYNCVRVKGADILLTDCSITYALGDSIVRTTGSATWMKRCKCDQPYPISTPAFPQTFAAWSAATGYSAGDIVSTAGFYIQCVHSGTSGGSAPTVRPYGTVFPDGVGLLTWSLVSKTNACSFLMDTGASEAHVNQCDFTGCWNGSCISMQNNLAGTAPFLFVVTDCVISQSYGSCVDMIAGHGLMMSCNEISGGISAGTSAIALRSAFTGDAQFVNNNIFAGGTGIYVGSGAQYVINGNVIGGFTNAIQFDTNVTDFNIIGNTLGNSIQAGANTNGIVISAGTSNYYSISNNNYHGNTTPITDGGTGTTKFITYNDGTLKAGSVGYTTGQGGAVTQATNKSTGVTLDKRTGTITMNNASLATNTKVAFTLTNSFIAATDIVLVSIKSGATANSYSVGVDSVGTGSCSISLWNTTGGSLGEAVVLSFVIIKGVAA